MQFSVKGGLETTRWKESLAVGLVLDMSITLLWVGNDKCMGGVGILLAEKWLVALFGVKHISDRIMLMLIKLVLEKSVVTFLSVYTPQAGLDDVKHLFYENLQWTLTKINASQIVFVYRDFNGHTEKNAHGYEGVHGGKGFGRRN